jgi:hypothetical protein
MGFTQEHLGLADLPSSGRWRAQTCWPTRLPAAHRCGSPRRSPGTCARGRARRGARSGASGAHGSDRGSIFLGQAVADGAASPDCNASPDRQSQAGTATQRGPRYLDRGGHAREQPSNGRPRWGVRDHSPTGRPVARRSTVSAKCPAGGLGRARLPLTNGPSSPPLHSTLPHPPPMFFHNHLTRHFDAAAGTTAPCWCRHRRFAVSAATGTRRLLSARAVDIRFTGEYLLQPAHHCMGVAPSTGNKP